jgi:hypothetical protein
MKKIIQNSKQIFIFSLLFSVLTFVYFLLIFWVYITENEYLVPLLIKNIFFIIEILFLIFSIFYLLLMFITKTKLNKGTFIFLLINILLLFLLFTFDPFYLFSFFYG